MTLLAERRDRFQAADIYPVITGAFCAGRSSLDVCRSVLEGGARIVQLREKDYSGRDLYELAEKYRQQTAARGALFILNDRPDIALAAGADGVHLGQSDLPLSAARKLAPDLLIGVSCHSLEEARRAQSEGADYVNLGPVFPTRTKNTASPCLGLSGLAEIIPRLQIPFTVMGGIKLVHLPELLALGVARAAMVTEITQARDIAHRVLELRKALGRGKEN